MSKRTNLKTWLGISVLLVVVQCTTATGDIIYTETTLERKNVNISNLAYALSVFGDYRIGNFVSRITLSMTGVPRGDIEYRYTGYALSIGYIFDL